MNMIQYKIFIQSYGEEEKKRMKSGLFLNISDDFYTRRYELNPKRLNGSKVVIYAECGPNTKVPNGGYYHLDLYFSANNIGSLDFITGILFGSGPMEKDELAKKIDSWVRQTVSESDFQSQVAVYLKQEEVWQKFVTENTPDDDIVNPWDLISD